MPLYNSTRCACLVFTWDECGSRPDSPCRVDRGASFTAEVSHG